VSVTLKEFDFKRDLIERVFCRIKASPIHGVGVFAIRPIPKGVFPMREFVEGQFGEASVESIQGDPNIPESVKKLVVDMCPEHDGIYDIPMFGINGIGISYYLNHSATPNMGEDDGNFYALRDILEDEELTVDYGTYGALNL
jgi:SET domain-containing protein